MSEICNIEVEQLLLGALLINNEAFGLISGQLLPEHFYEPLHKAIYDNASKMIRAGKIASPITIKSYLDENAKVGGLTVSQYLARLAAEAMPAMMAPTYANEIYDLAVDRSLINGAEDLIRAVRNRAPNVSPKELGEQAISAITTALSDEDTIYGATSFGEACDDALAATSQAYSGKKTVGVSYRLPPLERLIGPLCGGQLIILGGATKQGKSALAGQIAMGAAIDGFPVWMYSGEMTAMELAMRESSRDTKISVNRQKRGKVVEADYERLMQFRNANRDRPFYIQENRLTLDLVMERARAFVQRKGKGLIVVDHIGLIDRTKSEKSLADWEFGQVVTMKLKQLARELDCPVLGCAQLKKNVFNENRGPLNEKFLQSILNRRPRYTDLIGAVERDADHVIIPFRPFVFLKEHEPSEHSDLHLLWEEMVNDQKNKAKLVLALSREANWPAEVEMGWDGPTTTFYETGSAGESELIRREAISNPMALL
ncbi:AAA family ATPase [Phyllobacterium sp. BT25]|uniref:DNA 5'-3' helicase n=1 Tax=Phyllobacterium pellucidum TaxID=2740464 RepID=A0A849VN12_9HYPH|nr:DnaB-like helicase C-terminal domain-containing protein [Phyllobacterium pellucidum]NTS31292.1 AAA family ATPase [Phyllobacterium pellucidum]